jgi:hypothetical protein
MAGPATAAASAEHHLPPHPSLAPVRFSWGVVAACLVYVTAATAAWYGLRGSPWTASRYVPAIFAGSGVVFFLALWAFRGLAPWRLSRETLVVAVTSILYLSGLWLYGREGNFRQWFRDVRFEGELAPLYPFFYFAVSCVAWRTALPLLTGRLALGRPSWSYGYKVRGTFALWWVYVLAVVAVVPFVVYASTLPSFLARYPLGRSIIAGNEMAWEHFLVYQLSYGLVFLSGESFWRGYMLFGLSRQLGYLSLAFMVGPYVISHFGKPAPETFGAIVTGLFLGYLALQHRSFWLGVAAHWAIAMLMDVLAILRRGVVFT